MKLTQYNERTYIVTLNDAELHDLKAEAEHSELTLLDVMKAILLMTFVQFLSCRYFRSILSNRKG